MKRIYLFDPTCHTYRINIYKYFRKRFKEEGYVLKVFYDEDQKSIDEPGFKAINYSFVPFLKLHINDKPDFSIFFIWLRYIFSLPFILFCRAFLSVKTIVWSKGINITNINQPIKNNLYYLRQYAADALILYSDFEKQFIKASQEKVFVANNTINQHEYTLYDNKEGLKKEYDIDYKKVALFVGRIEKRKRLDLLIEVFSNNIKDKALVIVGPGLDDEYASLIKDCDNIFYLGAIYDLDSLSKLYSLSDLFCIPGHIGLGLNEAFLFGLPVVTGNINKDPSLVSSEPKMLFQDGTNGLYYDPFERDDLKEKLEILFSEEDIYEEYAENARSTFHSKAKIEIMFEGFLKAISYVDINS